MLKPRKPPKEGVYWTPTDEMFTYVARFMAAYLDYPKSKRIKRVLEEVWRITNSPNYPGKNWFAPYLTTSNGSKEGPTIAKAIGHPLPEADELYVSIVPGYITVYYKEESFPIYSERLGFTTFEAKDYGRKFREGFFKTDESS